MTKFLSLFKANTKPELSNALEILFDFVVVALVSLIFNGLVVNNNSSVAGQKFFMVGNAALLTTHWYAQSFFRQWFEKRKVFWRLWTFMSVFALAIMAIGIDLMAFMMNSPAGENRDFLEMASMIIFVSGFIFSRLIMSIQFGIAVYANKEDRPLVLLTRPKAISRMIVVLIGIVHLILVIFLKRANHEWLSYGFIPVYLIIEVLGNLINVTNKNIQFAPKVSMAYLKNRYSKLNLLFISSFFVSGTIQLAFYLKTSSDLYMIADMAGVYLIGFLLWWTYSDRVHRFGMKNNARNVIYYSIINIFFVASLTVAGAMTINAHTNKLAEWIVPVALFGYLLFVIMLIPVTKTFIKGKEDNCMERDVKFIYIKQLIPAIIVLATTATIFSIVEVPSWTIFAVVPPVLIYLNIASRLTIKKHIKLKN